MRKLVQIIGNTDDVIYEYVMCSGCDIHAGDTIKLWSGDSTVEQLFPYHGRFEYLFKHGAQLVDFSDHRGEVTLDNDSIYEVNGHAVEHRPGIVASSRRQRHNSERLPANKLAFPQLARVASTQDRARAKTTFRPRLERSTLLRGAVVQGAPDSIFRHCAPNAARMPKASPAAPAVGREFLVAS